MVTNVGLNMLYFIAQRRFMRNTTTDLMCVKRISAVFLCQMGLTDTISRKVYADKYYVNLNVLLDQDTPFLNQSQEYNRLIKTVQQEHSQLVNPSFDIQVECALKAHPRDGSAWHSNRHQLYKQTFAMAERPQGNPFQRMVDKYTEALKPW